MFRPALTFVTASFLAADLAAPFLDVDVWKWLVTQGGLALFAGLLFYFYRRDFIKEREAQDNRWQVLTRLVQSNTTAMMKMVASSERNTDASHRLSRAVENMDTKILGFSSLPKHD